MPRPHKRRLSKGRIARQNRRKFGEHVAVFRMALPPPSFIPKQMPIFYVRQPTTK